MQKRYDKKIDKKSFLFLVQGTIALASVLWNPWHQAYLLLLPFQFSSNWSQYILEYQAPPLRGLHPVFYVSLILGIGTASILLLKRKYSAFLIVLTFLWQGTKSVRMISLSLVALTPFILFAFHTLMEKESTLNKKWSFRLQLLFLGVFSTPPIHYLIHLWQINPPGIGLRKESFPIEISEALKKESTSRNILADFELASFLIFDNRAKHRFYLDGRSNILYSIEDLKRYYQIAGSPHELKKESQRLKIEYILTRFNTTSSNFFSAALESDQFFINVLEGDFVILSLNPLFRNISKTTLYPQCRNGLNSGKLRAERVLAKKTWPYDSYASAGLELQDLLETKPSLELVVREKSSLIERNDINRRLFIYYAIELKAFEQALEYFNNFKNMEPSDYLLRFEAAYKMGDFRLAAQIFDQWPVGWSTKQETARLEVERLLKGQISVGSIQTPSVMGEQTFSQIQSSICSHQ